MIKREDVYTEEFLQLRLRFKKCFKEYPDILFQLLADMGTFQSIGADQGQVALRNYGIHLLDLLGVNDEDGIEGIIGGYIGLPLEINKPLEEE